METIRAIVTRMLSPRPGAPETGSVLFLAEYETPTGLKTGKVSGRAWGVREGDCLSCQGVWDDKKQYMGRPDVVLKAKSIRPDMPQSLPGAESYLSKIFNQARHDVTLPRIRAWLAKHGPAILRECVVKPGLLLGLTSDPARYGKNMLDDWSERTQGGQAIALMESSGVEQRVIERIVSQMRDMPLKRLRENPYRVAGLRDVGFENADKIGAYLGFASDDRNRLTAAVSEVLRAQEALGSTAADLDTLMDGLGKVSRIERSSLLKFMREAAQRQDHDIAIYTVEDQPMAALLRNYVSEIDLQSKILVMLSTGRRNMLAGVHAAASSLFASKPDFSRFDAVQRAAVEMAASEPLSIITGGPGTGKSTVMEAVSALCENLDRLGAQGGGTLFLAAPTGKAAKRLGEATGRKATTLHRLLKARGGPGATQFGYNSKNPLPEGCVVVVDEASMMDSVTAAALFSAMPPSGRLILVGDRNQLPSVGAGSVLANLLQATVAGGRRLVPSVELVNVYRQSKDSAIATGAALIKDGIMPVLTPNEVGGVSFRAMDTRDISSFVDAVERLVCEEIPAKHPKIDPLRDIAVLCPMAPGEGGTWQLNARLSARLNPNGACLPGVAISATDDAKMPVPRNGDRVMLTENDADNDVMNGDVGTITGAGVGENGRPVIKVSFDSGQQVDIPAARWRSLILAYAGTIHKSQGSQYPVVVMPMLMGQSRMLDRALVYTGWTRAKSELVLLGDQQALARAVANTGPVRSTMLSRFLAVLRPLGRGERPDWASIAALAQEAMNKAVGSNNTAAGSTPVLAAAALPDAARPVSATASGARMSRLFSSSRRPVAATPAPPAQTLAQPMVAVAPLPVSSQVDQAAPGPAPLAPAAAPAAVQAGFARVSSFARTGPRAGPRMAPQTTQATPALPVPRPSPFARISRPVAAVPGHVQPPALQTNPVPSPNAGVTNTGVTNTGAGGQPDSPPPTRPISKLFASTRRHVVSPAVKVEPRADIAGPTLAPADHENPDLAIPSPPDQRRVAMTRTHVPSQARPVSSLFRPRGMAVPPNTDLLSAQSTGGEELESNPSP